MVLSIVLCGRELGTGAKEKNQECDFPDGIMHSDVIELADAGIA